MKEETNKSVFTMIGATSHGEGERQKDDFYATEPKAIEMLLKKEKFNKNVWECACGMGHISKELIKNGFNVKSTDLVDRGFGESRVDFLMEYNKFNGDIITNPPFKLASEFVYKSMDLLEIGNKLAMFLRIQFLEGQDRLKMFKEYPPQKIYVASQRLNCAKEGDFEKYTSSAMCYAWFIWIKGNKNLPIIDWLE